MKEFKLKITDKNCKSKFSPVIIYANNLEEAIKRFRSHYCYNLCDNPNDLEIIAIREVKNSDDNKK